MVTVLDCVVLNCGVLDCVVLDCGMEDLLEVQDP